VGYAAAHPDGVEPLVVGQPVDFRLPRPVAAEHADDVTGGVDGVAALPRPRAVRTLSRYRDLGPQRALAATLDYASRRLQQHGKVTSQQLRALAAQPQHAVALRLDFLAVVKDVGHVPGRLRHRRRET
jgi:hypothetical protein